MNPDVFTYLLIAGSVLAGWVWGRISSRLPIPEWLRLLSTPLWTGALAVVLMSMASIAFLATHSWQSSRLLEAATLGIGPLTRLLLGYGFLWFLVGAAFGLPATLGWVVGYRQPTNS